MTGHPDRRTLKKLGRAIRKLPREQREAFCAIRFEDLTYEQIARRTGRTVAEVEQLFAEALLTVMRRLDRKPKRWWHFR